MYYPSDVEVYGPSGSYKESVPGLSSAHQNILRRVSLLTELSTRDGVCDRRCLVKVKLVSGRQIIIIDIQFS